MMKKTMVIINFLLLLLQLLLQQADSYGSTTIRYLPGFKGPLPFQLETGYIGVGEAEEEQLFYYFIKSESNPEEDPLVVWLTGGPGCSSLSTLLFENGPVTIKIDDYYGGLPSLVSTTYSWTKAANIIYLDQPVGTGFSYSRTSLVDIIPSDTRSAKQVDEFVRKWLAKHPEFLSNPFYVAGSSYSGKVVPAIVQEISKRNSLGYRLLVNLQGYMLGNPITDLDDHFDSRVSFAHGMALISDELYESLRRSCKGDYLNVDHRSTKCSKLVEDFNKCVSGIDIQYILGPKYVDASDPFITSPSEHLMTLVSNRWADEESVRSALRVKKGSIGEWIRCYRDIPYKFDIENSVPYHKNNSIQGYRSLIFSGDHDMTVSFLSTQEWIRSLNYSITDDWRPWMIQNQVAGYTRTYANKMTFATVKGGGHTMVYKPEECFVMFKRWISNQPL